MNEITIKCPSCGKTLRLKEMPANENASFICPVCKEKHRVSSCKQMQPKLSIANESTQYGPLPAPKRDNNEETCFEAPKKDNNEETRAFNTLPKLGVLEDLQGHKYQLNKGVNTIGRKAKSSQAVIQIDDPDCFMSRNHASIEVRNTGVSTLYVLKNTFNKNRSYVNGSLVSTGDQMILNDGDRLKFGTKELIFKIKQS